MNRRTLFRAVLAAPLALLGKIVLTPAPKTALRIYFSGGSWVDMARADVFQEAIVHGHAADTWHRMVRR